MFSCITGMKHYYMCALLKHRISGSRLDICIEMCAQWRLDLQKKSLWVEVKVDTQKEEKLCLKLVYIQEEEEEGWSQVVAHDDGLQHDWCLCL